MVHCCHHWEAHPEKCHATIAGAHVDRKWLQRNCMTAVALRCNQGWKQDFLYTKMFDTQYRKNIISIDVPSLLGSLPRPRYEFSVSQFCYEWKLTALDHEVDEWTSTYSLMSMVIVLSQLPVNSSSNSMTLLTNSAEKPMNTRLLPPRLTYLTAFFHL